MERLVKVIFGVCLFVYFVVAVVSRVPAQWATKAIIDSAPGVSIGGVAGTIWKGSAASAVINIHGQDFDLGRLTWRVQPMSLLSLNACVDVESDLVEAQLCRSLSGNNRIQDLILEELPAKSLNRVIGFAKIEGKFSLVVKNAQVNDRGVVKVLDGNLRWIGARGDAGGGWFDLGSFNADVKEDGEGGLSAAITDTAGEFELDLKGGFSVAGGPTMKGLVKPRPDAPNAIVDSLGFLGEAQDDGAFLVTWPM